MRLHPRTRPVQKASNAIQQSLWGLQEKHGLTDVEMMQVLADSQLTILRYMLRDERHPGEPDRKADEA